MELARVGSRGTCTPVVLAGLLVVRDRVAHPPLTYRWGTHPELNPDPRLISKGADELPCFLTAVEGQEPELPVEIYASTNGRSADSHGRKVVKIFSGVVRDRSPVDALYHGNKIATLELRVFRLASYTQTELQRALRKVNSSHKTTPGSLVFATAYHGVCSRDWPERDKVLRGGTGSVFPLGFDPNELLKWWLAVRTPPESGAWISRVGAARVLEPRDPERTGVDAALAAAAVWAVAGADDDKNIGTSFVPCDSAGSLFGRIKATEAEKVAAAVVRARELVAQEKHSREPVRSLAAALAKQVVGAAVTSDAAILLVSMDAEDVKRTERGVTNEASEPLRLFRLTGGRFTRVNPDEVFVEAITFPERLYLSGTSHLVFETRDAWVAFARHREAPSQIAKEVEAGIAETEIEARRVVPPDLAAAVPLPRTQSPQTRA